MYGLLDYHSFEPQLAPVGGDGARAVEPAFGIQRLAHNAFECDARLLHVSHLAGDFVDDFGDRVANSNRAAAVGSHFFGVEREAAVVSLGVERSLDFELRLDADELARLEVEPPGWSFEARGRRGEQAGGRTAGEGSVHPVVAGAENAPHERHASLRRGGMRSRVKQSIAPPTILTFGKGRSFSLKMPFILVNRRRNSRFTR